MTFSTTEERHDETWCDCVSPAGAAGLALVAGQAMAQTTINWALWDWDKTVYYQPLIDAFEAKNPDIKVDYTDLGSVDYDQMVMTQLTGGGSDLDVITIKDIPGYMQMINTGRLLDLTGDAIIPKDTSGYGGLVEALQVDGKQYAMPMRTDFWIIYYNKDPFDKAGVPYPTDDMTWKQYDEIAARSPAASGRTRSMARTSMSGARSSSFPPSPPANTRSSPRTTRS